MEKRRGPPPCQSGSGCSNPAKIRKAKDGAQLCGPCFSRNFEDDVHEAIVNNKLFKVLGFDRKDHEIGKNPTENLCENVGNLIFSPINDFFKSNFQKKKLGHFG